MDGNGGGNSGRASVTGASLEECLPYPQWRRTLGRLRSQVQSKADGNYDLHKEFLRKESKVQMDEAKVEDPSPTPTVPEPIPYPHGTRTQVHERDRPRLGERQARAGCGVG